MESSSQAPWSSVSGEQEERELKDGLLRLAAGRGCGRPGLLCPAGTRSGVQGRRGNGRARPRREQQSAAGLRRARLWAGRRGWPTPPRTAAQQPCALPARPRAPPPRGSLAAAPPHRPPLRRWTADSHRDTLLGELLGPRPHAASALRGAARCADRDAGAPLRWLSGELQPPRV